MGYALGTRSRTKLAMVDPFLRAVVEEAIQVTEQDFFVVEGLRTVEMQKLYLSQGRSKTMNSLHLRQADGYAHAVDLCPCASGVALWQDIPAFRRVAESMFRAADSVGVLLQWGGDWDMDGDSRDETFLDMPHFQLPRPWNRAAAKLAAASRVMLRGKP
jgi:peptidoglycan L-alanyl-D-glutamate endopeptidase CwlK